MSEAAMNARAPAVKLTCEAIARAFRGEPAKKVGAELYYHHGADGHVDRNPSVKINTVKDAWIDGPCGKGGNAWELAAFFIGCDPNDKKTIAATLRERGLLNGASGNSSRRSTSEQRRVAECYYLPGLRKVRIEPGRDGRSKEFVWEHRAGDTWERCHDCKHEIPLYGNRIFREHDQLGIVLAFEGEAKADLAGELGFAAISFKEMQLQHCEQLAGLDVILWPDRDASGETQAKAKAQMMHDSRQPRLIRMITPPAELPEGGDIVDAVRSLGWGRGEIDNLIRNAPEWKPAKTANASGFTLTPLGELLAKPDLPVDYVLENRLVAGTVSVVVAKPKVGKSTFSRNLCLAVSRGKDFLGLKTKPGECIYLALEEREEEVRADFRAMGADGSEPILIHAATAPSEGILALCDLIRQWRPVLVVVDPLFRLAHIRDANAYAEIYAALGPLIDVARIAGTHVQLTHHAGKSMKLDAIDSALGSTAIGGAVAAMLVIRRTEAYRTLQSVQRVGPDMPETVLEFEADSRRVSLGGSRLEVDRRECEKAILAFLEGADSPQTQEQIRDSVEGKTRIIRAALTALAESGRITKAGDGKKGKPFLYEFPNSGSQHIPGTREPESKNGPDTRINTGEIVVPEKPQKSILVPGDPEGLGTSDSEPSQADTLEV